MGTASGHVGPNYNVGIEVRVSKEGASKEQAKEFGEQMGMEVIDVREATRGQLLLVLRVHVDAAEQAEEQVIPQEAKEHGWEIHAIKRTAGYVLPEEEAEADQEFSFDNHQPPANPPDIDPDLEDDQ